MSVFIGDRCQEVVSTAVITPQAFLQTEKKKLLGFNVTIPILGTALSPPLLTPTILTRCAWHRPRARRSIPRDKKRVVFSRQGQWAGMKGRITDRHFHRLGGWGVEVRWRMEGRGVWIRGWWFSLKVSHPCPSLLLYMIPGTGQGAPKGDRGYIYTLRQEKGQAGWMWQANRQWGSGMRAGGWRGGLGMNHRRIGAWQWMNNPPWLPKPHYFPPSPAGPEIHVCACCQFIRGRMSFLFWLQQDRPGGPQEDPALFNSTSTAPLRALISACVINTISV